MKAANSLALASAALLAFWGGNVDGPTSIKARR